MGTRLGLLDDGYRSDGWREEIVSNTNTVEILFHTDGSGKSSGWTLDWGIVGKIGVLTSPNYPWAYPNSDTRESVNSQTIQVAEGKTIRFSFTDFRTELECDYVRILDEDGTNLTPKLFGQNRLSGGPGDSCCLPVIGENFSTESNFIYVEFTTNGSGQMAGWKLKWIEQ